MGQVLQSSMAGDSYLSQNVEASRRTLRRGEKMTRTHATYLFTLMFLCSAAMLNGTETKRDWRKGQLLAVNVEGHGGGRRSVVWRSYCIDAGDHVYSAVSKRRARMNLEVNDPVRF